MRMNAIRIAGSRRTRLTQKISKRIDREHPERKRKRFVQAALILALILLNHLCEGNKPLMIIWFIALFAALIYFEIDRLRRKAPRPRWRDCSLESGMGAAILLFVSILIGTTEPWTPDNKALVVGLAAAGAASLVLFGFALRRFIFIKREIAEEQEQIRRRAERRRKMELL